MEKAHQKVSKVLHFWMPKLSLPMENDLILIVQPQRDFIFSSITYQTFKYFFNGLQVKTTHVCVLR